MNRIILVSGGFDPIHGGHIKYIREAKKVDQVHYVLHLIQMSG